MSSPIQPQLPFGEPKEAPGPLRFGDLARVSCSVSHYHGIIGEISEIQPLTDYAILDMPKGTELRIENIERNLILLRLKPTARRRFKGDPQWFAMKWLVKVGTARRSEQYGTLTRRPPADLPGREGAAGSAGTVEARASRKHRG